MSKPVKLPNVHSELLQFANEQMWHIENYERARADAEYGMWFEEWLTCHASDSDAQIIFDRMTDNDWDRFLSSLQDKIESAEYVLQLAKGE